jgi:hypothetical protein
VPNTIEFSGKTFTLVDALPTYLTMKVVDAANSVEKDEKMAPQMMSLFLRYVLSIVVPEERDALDEHLMEHDIGSFDELNEKIGTAMQLIAGDPKVTAETLSSLPASSPDSKSRFQVVSFAQDINLPQNPQVG